MLADEYTLNFISLSAHIQPTEFYQLCLLSSSSIFQSAAVPGWTLKKPAQQQALPVGGNFIRHIMRLTILFLVTLILSCNSNKTKPKIENSSMFTYDIQYGGNPHDKYDLKGQTDYDNFISSFDTFPWLDEIEKANANPNGCSPTLSVKNKTDERDFWVSMSGDRNNHGYLVGYVYPKTKKGFLGFGKEKTTKWVEIYLTEDKQQVKGFFKLYFDKNYDQLHIEIKKLEKFGEMEAQNQ